MAEDLGRWLRAVRPADEEWDREGALREVRRRTRSGSRRTAWIAVPAAGFGVAAVAVAAALITQSLAPSSAPRAAVRPPGSSLPVPRPALQALHPLDTCPALLADLRARTAASVGPYGLPGGVSGLVGDELGASSPPALAAAAPVPGSAGTSTTNVQEPDVDEPDVVKTDGQRVVTVTDGVLHVVDARDRSLTATLDLTQYVGASNAQLLVSGDHALVLLGGGYINPVPSVLPAPGPGFSYAGAHAETTVLSVDLAPTPVVTGSERLDGGLVAARMVGSTVRLVTASAPEITLPQSSGADEQRTAANRAAILAAPLSDWLPRWTATAGTATSSGTVPCSSVSLPTTYTGASFATVYTFDAASAPADPHPVTIAADGDTVYATDHDLYLTSTEPAGLAAETPRPTRVQDPSTTTSVHRFDTAGGGPPAYLGSTTVPGSPIGSYSLSEYDGSLRIATSEAGTGATNAITVLDAQTLTRTGGVSGLGDGERLYAVRFTGPTAYVVTFRNTDPLYVVDLSDPAHPRTAGSLQLTGYSTYLHDAGGGRVIGVGQEAGADGRVSGTQVSLFDVHDPTTPVRTGHVVVSSAVAEGTLDPHAFLYWQPTGLLVVPEESWDAAQAGRVLVLHIAGGQLTEVGTVANPTSTDGGGIVRSLLVDGALWTVSGSGVRVSDPGSLQQQAFLPFA